MQRIAELSIEYGKYENEIDKSQKIGTLKEEKRVATKFFKNKEAEFFLLEEGNEVVGFVSISVDKRGKSKRGIFHTIFIEKNYRGKGEGTQLLNHAISYLKDKGCSSVRSHVFPKNKRSLKLYKKMGFKVEKSTGFSISKATK